MVTDKSTYLDGRGLGERWWGGAFLRGPVLRRQGRSLMMCGLAPGRGSMGCGADVGGKRELG